ncbi:hypothetical protein BJ138DRAFT_1105681 [Hygrophoropsis aurantiaca]|uniref:Uncharacterized protein n=1 Tax=Hygrophoropsis aurantiaca TaxID=72124 RepID=A0ACB7ZZL7_9AGAM|nr:hypothetical protein BJ138DRAFT_1105681 [Hygrophoropsis aurantiaca]
MPRISVLSPHRSPAKKKRVRVYGKTEPYQCSTCKVWLARRAARDYHKRVCDKVNRPTFKEYVAVHHRIDPPSSGQGAARLRYPTKTFGEKLMAADDTSRRKSEHVLSVDEDDKWRVTVTPMDRMPEIAPTGRASRSEPSNELTQQLQDLEKDLTCPMCKYNEPMRAYGMWALWGPMGCREGDAILHPNECLICPTCRSPMTTGAEFAPNFSVRNSVASLIKILGGLGDKYADTTVQWKSRLLAWEAAVAVRLPPRQGSRKQPFRRGRAVVQVDETESQIDEDRSGNYNPLQAQ